MIRIFRRNGIVNAIVPLTPSKSITNRALIIKALSGKSFEIQNTADADDTKILESVLQKLPSEINVNNAGTAFRFLTAFLSIQNGTFILDGSERMRQRPVRELVHALHSIDADIKFAGKENFPPLKITGKKLKGGKISIDASESSQFISALLLIAPVLSEGLEIEMTGTISSRSYIDMTLSLMNYFGIKTQSKDNTISILHQQYIPQKIIVENDWSAASFWYEIVALSDESEITLKGLRKKSMQGDSIIAEIMKNFGVVTEYANEDVIISKNAGSIISSRFDCDFSSCPDLVIPVAVLCGALKIPVAFMGVKNLRIKESDRLIALKNELLKIGANVELNDDSFTITSSGESTENKMFHSYNDHRMVMALAPLALVKEDVLIDDHLPVTKSYPGFWEQLRSAGFEFKIT